MKMFFMVLILVNDNSLNLCDFFLLLWNMFWMFQLLLFIRKANGVQNMNNIGPYWLLLYGQNVFLLHLNRRNTYMVWNDAYV